VSHSSREFNPRAVVRIGTRASKLARFQTNIVVQRLGARYPDSQFKISLITTGGDNQRELPIAHIGSTGVFVKELEDALLQDEVDLVVHSLKDLPTALPDGLELVALLAREDPRDVLVSRARLPFDQLPANSRVATSSRRRSAQLSARRRDLRFIDIRGNIPTRLRKHDDGQCDAIVLAAAGLIRLNLQERITEFLDYRLSVPAAGQGALAVECRSRDEDIRLMAQTIDEPVVRAETGAERTVLRVLGGGCSVPIGVLGRADGEKLLLTACVATLDGSKVIHQELEGSLVAPEELGYAMAAALEQSGACEIIRGLQATAPSIVSPP